jgi:hypothetical protein
MSKVNFRQQSFRGTLREVLEQGRLEIANSGGNFLRAHQWLREQLLEKNNILPIRTFGKCKSRGKLHSFGTNGSSFIPVDNEPLASLYQHWIQSGQIPQNIGSALSKGLVIASWRCDEPPSPIGSLRFKGVKANFRDRGLKLAHVNDAALGISTTVPVHEQVAVRFLRSLSPLNVFLFPSIRCCDVHLISTGARFSPKKADWAEDSQLKGVALGWLLEWIGKPLLDVLPDFGFPRIEPAADWKRIAESTIIEVTPKRQRGTGEQRTLKQPKPSASLQATPQACPKISKQDAVTVLEAVEILRQWRTSFPAANRLDGRTGGAAKKNGNEPWLHIRVEGYGERDKFASRYGTVFEGKDYNGIVNFHADAKASAIDHFIELLDQADDYRDVLRPSATYETMTKPQGSGVKPKFALRGYEDQVEGFFLYHDGWR